MLPADKPGFQLFRRNGKPLCIIGGRGYYNQSWPDGRMHRRRHHAHRRAVGPSSARARCRASPLRYRHAAYRAEPRSCERRRSTPRCCFPPAWTTGRAGISTCAISILAKTVRVIAFSGCIQGRDIKETGPRGAQLVTLSEGAVPQLEFIPTASVVWQRLRVDVSDCTTLPEISDLIIRELFRANGKAHCEEMISRIALTGTTALHEVLSRPDVLAGPAQARERFVCVVFLRHHGRRNAGAAR